MVTNQIKNVSVLMRKPNCNPIVEFESIIKDTMSFKIFLGKEGKLFNQLTKDHSLDYIWHEKATNMVQLWGPLTNCNITQKVIIHNMKNFVKKHADNSNFTFNLDNGLNNKIISVKSTFSKKLIDMKESNNDKILNIWYNEKNGDIQFISDNKYFDEIKSKIQHELDVIKTMNHYEMHFDNSYKTYLSVISGNSDLYHCNYDFEKKCIKLYGKFDEIVNTVNVINNNIQKLTDNDSSDIIEHCIPYDLKLHEIAFVNGYHKKNMVYTCDTLNIEDIIYDKDNKCFYIYYENDKKINSSDLNKKIITHVDNIVKARYNKKITIKTNKKMSLDTCEINSMSEKLKKIEVDLNNKEIDKESKELKYERDQLRENIKKMKIDLYDEIKHIEKTHNNTCENQIQNLKYMNNGCFTMYIKSTIDETIVKKDFIKFLSNGNEDVVVDINFDTEPIIIRYMEKTMSEWLKIENICVSHNVTYELSNNTFKFEGVKKQIDKVIRIITKNITTIKKTYNFVKIAYCETKTTSNNEVSAKILDAKILEKFKHSILSYNSGVYHVIEKIRNISNFIYFDKTENIFHVMFKKNHFDEALVSSQIKDLLNNMITDILSNYCEEQFTLDVDIDLLGLVIGKNGYHIKRFKNNSNVPSIQYNKDTKKVTISGLKNNVMKAKDDILNHTNYIIDLHNANNA